MLRAAPDLLQTKIIELAGLAVASCVLGVAILLFFPHTLAMPFLILAIFLAILCGRLYRVVATEQYLTLKGTVFQVEQTLLFHRINAILIETNGMALRVVVRNRHRRIATGDRITLYIQDSTPIYEWHKLHQLSSYIAIEVEERSSH